MKQKKVIKQTVKNMDMDEMLKAAELNDFRLLTTIGYLNRLAMISGNDHPFTPLSTIKDMRDEELAGLLATHIVYHDAGEFKDEDGNSAGFPIIASIDGRDEDGKLRVTYADAIFGGKLTHCRLIIEDGDTFATVFCEEANQTIIVADGQWFTA